MAPSYSQDLLLQPLTPGRENVTTTRTSGPLGHVAVAVAVHVSDHDHVYVYVYV